LKETKYFHGQVYQWTYEVCTSNNGELGKVQEVGSSCGGRGGWRRSTQVGGQWLALIEGGSTQPKTEQNRGGHGRIGGSRYQQARWRRRYCPAARLGGDRWPAVGGRWWQ